MFAGQGYGATRERSQHVNVLIGMIHLREKISAGERGRIIDTLSFSGQPRAGLASGGVGRGEGPRWLHLQ